MGLKGMPDAATRKALEDLLLFYRDSGLDAMIGDEPIDRFALSRHEEALRQARRGEAVTEGAEPPPDTSTPTASRNSAPNAPPRSEELRSSTGNGSGSRPAMPSLVMATPSGEAVMAARAAADTAETLDALRDILAGFQGCNLRFTATNLVFGDGNPAGRVMFVGEAPGMEEDLQGVPFVGRSGQLLDKMLAAVGLDRGGAYIANVIPWRPPGNRKPTPQETEICRPFIERQIRLVDPDVLVLLGDAAAKQLFRSTTGITRLRGQWRSHDTGAREIRAMATFHPAYLLRTPAQKRLAWRDLLALKAELAGR